MASILGVPSYVLAYDVKVRELAAILGIEEWCVDINEPFDAAAVGDQITRLISQRDEVAEHLLVRSAELGAAAQSNFAAAREWVATAR
jgi:polysaccharide pyruvyl transferase WcaK-like protein